MERFNLCEMNVVNVSRLADLLAYGRRTLGGQGQTNYHIHSDNLSGKMDDFLLSVRNMNHKYIVVGG